jgi:hypothetical protein
MADTRKQIKPDEALDSAKSLLEKLEQDWPDEQYANQHDVLLMAAYALLGPGGVRQALDQP